MNNSLVDDISSWLTRYLAESKLQVFVVGVSGGVDSAVVSSLCAHTGIKTYVLNIPIQSQEKNSNLSARHCEFLVEKYNNVEYVCAEATPVFEALMHTLEQDNTPHALSSANAKSRIRMAILYYIAGKHGGLVVGTGNKVEDFGVGFFTKYGDGGVDLSPIADLTKTEVRALAKELGVDESIIDAPPTDGLWEDSRTDEDQIGASYEELEWAMAHEKSPIDTFSEREKEVMRIYQSYHTKNLHKMISIPIFKKDKKER